MDKREVPLRDELATGRVVAEIFHAIRVSGNNAELLKTMLDRWADSRVQAALAPLRKELEEVQRAKYGTPCKCETWIEACGLAEDERDAAQSALRDMERQRDELREQIGKAILANETNLREVQWNRLSAVDAMARTGVRLREIIKQPWKTIGEQEQGG